MPDLPLSAELAARYDFSAMPEDGFQGDEWNPYTAYVTVKEASDIPSSTDPIDLPVRVLEEEDTDYSPARELSATFTPDTAVTVGEFNEYQGLAIDYYYPMIDAELSEGYDIQAGYTVSIPLENYQGETLSGTLTIPLPQGYDGASARILGDLRLFGRGHVHDHAAFQHFSQTGLQAKGALFHRITSMTPRCTVSLKNVARRAWKNPRRRVAGWLYAIPAPLTIPAGRALAGGKGRRVSAHF